jgi:hypothetical protein
VHTETQNLASAATASRSALPRRVPVDSEVLFELLSDRLLSDFPADVWREVFSGAGVESVRFECGVLTFLAVARLSPEWTRAQLASIARRHGGHVESFGAPATFGFPEARRALELAMQLQRESGHSLGMALLTAPCTMATFDLDGCQGCLSLGAEAHIAARKASHTPEGSVYVWGETYPLIARVLERQQHGAMIAREVQDEVITSAMLSFPR